MVGYFSCRRVRSPQSKRRGAVWAKGQKWSFADAAASCRRRASRGRPPQQLSPPARFRGGRACLGGCLGAWVPVASGGGSGETGAISQSRHDDQKILRMLGWLVLCGLVGGLVLQAARSSHSILALTRVGLRPRRWARGRREPTPARPSCDCRSDDGHPSSRRPDRS